MDPTDQPVRKPRGIIGPILGLTAVIICIQVVIDILIGEKAEFFNAYATLVQLTSWIHGRTLETPMIAGEERLGAWALPVATAILIGLPLLVSTAIVGLWRLVSQR